MTGGFRHHRDYLSGFGVMEVDSSIAPALAEGWDPTALVTSKRRVWNQGHTFPVASMRLIDEEFREVFDL